jgi:hypothetical protein
MTSRPRLAWLIGLATGLVLSTSGCDPYTYFNVDVSINTNTVPRATQRLVNACVVYVLADGKQIEKGRDLNTVEGPAACHSPDTPDHIGLLDYSTARSSGTVKFIINMIELNPPNDITVQGSAEAAVKGGGAIVTVPLVAEPCTSTCPIDTSSFK